MLHNSNLNSASAVETGDRFRNGASPKSQMSRGNFFKKSCFALLAAVLSLTFVACGKDDKGEKMYELITGEVEPELKENYWKKEREINDYRDKMKNEGFELFSKHFWNLWD
jgi:hypothetical protein